VKQKNDSLNAERMKVLFSQNACSKFEMENTSTGIHTVKTICSDGSVFVTRLLIK